MWCGISLAPSNLTWKLKIRSSLEDTTKAASIDMILDKHFNKYIINHVQEVILFVSPVSHLHVDAELFSQSFLPAFIFSTDTHISEVLQENESLQQRLQLLELHSEQDKEALKASADQARAELCRLVGSPWPVQPVVTTLQFSINQDALKWFKRIQCCCEIHVSSITASSWVLGLCRSRPQLP